MERTYIMIKPDGVQRGLVGEIISRFERKVINPHIELHHFIMTFLIKSITPTH
jgi:nucleoside diphosphate kinase